MKCSFFFHIGPFFSPGRGSLSAAGHARGPRVLTAQVWAPAWLRGAGQPWCNSICTSRYSLCDSHERCFCACAGLRACVPSLTQSGRFQRTFTLNLNSTRAVHRHPNSSGTKSSAATSHGLIYILIPCHAYVRRNTCVPRFQVNHVPKGSLVRRNIFNYVPKYNDRYTFIFSTNGQYISGHTGTF